MTEVLLVARREFRIQARSKGFVIGLLISSLVIVLIIALPQLLGSDDTYEVGLVGTESEALSAVVVATADEIGISVETELYDDERSARAAVADGDLDAAVVDGRSVLADGEPEPRLDAALQNAHRSVATQQQLVDAGLDPEQVQEALQVAPLAHVSVTGDTRYDDAREAIAFLVVLALFFLIFGSAIQVAMGVVEEKSSRIVEILLVAVRPWQLLAGKIGAFALLGIVQLVVFALAGIGAAAVLGSLPELPPGTPGIFAAALAGFIPGFIFYGAMAAALGSLVSRQEEVNQVIGPMTMVVVASYLVSIWAINSPASAANEVFSMIPPFSAMVMPVRVAATDVPVWQAGVAFVALAVAAAVVVVIGGRIYERAILRTGARLKLTQVLRDGKGVAAGQPGR